ncbi:nuclear transport factor 2 family protein [Pontibacter qinzhouensis]|uniref:Nuclear transport factor 2 family protein n=1 Tax=Pontibacter qinzhouensis TaxID=2603253 RepID=A0A5C8K6W9_9BACT|nr:nuclear transport factor 2 family protein [Pontibacter qinzhouensis]TXK46391.1 nuclear transport factor 2 family protein [Pontibacter qinzhouensis]
MKRNLRAILLVAGTLLWQVACQPPQQTTTTGNAVATHAAEEVLQVLQQQSDCWSKGDLECYMQGYWQSDSLVFIGKRGLTYGWQQTLSNYQKSYPTSAAMGKLNFDILENKALAADTRLVVGKWLLTRAEGNLEGHFSVIFKRFPAGWKIISDHSS